MVMNRLEAARNLPENSTPKKQFAIDTAKLILENAGIKDPGMPTVTTSEEQAVRSPEAQPDLRQRTYELLSMVREPSAEERESLVKKGFIFLPIEAKTLAQVVREHPDHFWKDESQYANGLPHPDLRTHVPMAMEVAFNPNQLYIQDSLNKTQANQLGMIEEYSKTNLEKELPGAKALMLPATVEAQADIAYFKETKGKKLFRDRFVRALDQTAGSGVAIVGRDRPDDRLDVVDWDAEDGNENVGAPLAVVFIKK